MKFLCDNCEKYPCDDNAIKLMKYCPVYSPKPKPQTNADRIRAMTDEELAEYMCRPQRVCPVDDCEECYADNCRKCILEWLKKEVEDG